MRHHAPSGGGRAGGSLAPFEGAQLPGGRWAGWGPLWWLPGLVLFPCLTVGLLNDDFVAFEKFSSIPLSQPHRYIHLEEFQFFRPVGLVVFRWLLATSGGWPVLLHLFTLLLFFAAAYLAGAVAARLLGERARPWGAALALVYPGRVETAAWLAAAFDLLALLGVVAVVAYLSAPEPRGSWWAVAGLAAAAVLAKESALVLPLLAAAGAMLGVFPGRGGASRWVPLWATSAGVSVAFALRFPFLAGVGGYAELGLPQAAANLARLPELLGRCLLWPVHPHYGVWSTVANLLVALAGVAWLAGLGTLSRRERRVLWWAGVVWLVGLLPPLAYLDPATATFCQSRYLTISGAGVALAAAAVCARAPRWVGGLVLGAWTLATATNLGPWREAAQVREEFLAAVEVASREGGRHVVWLGGQSDLWRGAQLLGGRLELAVRRALPGRQVRVTSEYMQRWRGETPCPPTAAEGERVHIFTLSNTRPWVRKTLDPCRAAPERGAGAPSGSVDEGLEDGQERFRRHMTAQRHEPWSGPPAAVEQGELSPRFLPIHPVEEQRAAAAHASRHALQGQGCRRQLDAGTEDGSRPAALRGADEPPFWTERRRGDHLGTDVGAGQPAGAAGGNEGKAVGRRVGGEQGVLAHVRGQRRFALIHRGFAGHLIED